MTEVKSTADTAKIVPEEGSTMDDNTSKIAFLCVAFAIVISFVALVLAIMGVANNGGNEYYIGSNGGSLASSDDKIWMFHIGHFIGNIQYLDEASGTIKGYDIDIVNAVCRIANKNCRLVWDLYERCWTSAVGQRPSGGIGLMGGWYDACVGWSHTLDRARTFLFSDSFAQGNKVFIWKKVGHSFTYPDFTNQKVGFLDGWHSDEHCLARYSNEITGFDELSNEQVTHYANEDLLLNALETGEVDVAFVSEVYYENEHPQLERAYSFNNNKCVFGGPAMMMRQDQTELADWFNAAFENLRNTNEYQTICRKIDEEHGDQPGDVSTDVCV